jgi:hypothetical protein
MKHDRRIHGMLTLAVMIALLTTTTTTLHIGVAEAQEETLSSGDLTVPEGNNLFGGDTIGTYSIGMDRDGLRVQVDMNISPTDDKAYQSWLVGNTTENDLAVGQLVDNALGVTLPSTNTSQYGLIVVTEEPVNDPDPARNSSAVIAGAELES